MSKSNASHYERQRRQRLGQRAEWVAALYLQLKGYRILARRFKCPVGEIDLIAKRGRRVAFIEVKYRQTFESAAFSITDKQKQRIERAAAFWLMRHEGISYETLSFDVMLMRPRRLPRHLKSAFEGRGTSGF